MSKVAFLLCFFAFLLISMLTLKSPQEPNVLPPPPQQGDPGATLPRAHCLFPTLMFLGGSVEDKEAALNSTVWLTLRVSLLQRHRPGSSFLHLPDHPRPPPMLNTVTRSRKQTNPSATALWLQNKNQIFERRASQTGSRSARGNNSFFLVSGADFPLRGTKTCCTFSVVLFSPWIAVTASFRNLLRQSVCCLFYGLKPMHARVKWW